MPAQQSRWAQTQELRCRRSGWRRQVLQPQPCAHCPVAPSARLQPHPVVLPSDPAGAHHHVQARHGTQGHCAARGEAAGAARAGWVGLRSRRAGGCTFAQCASSGHPSVSFHCPLAVQDPGWAPLIKQSDTDIRGPFPNRAHAHGIWGLGTGGPLMAISFLPHGTPAAHLPGRAQGLELGKGADGRDTLEREERAGHGQGSVYSRRSWLPFALVTGMSVELGAELGQAGCGPRVLGDAGHDAGRARFPADLPGLPALPAVTPALLQPRSTAAHAAGEYTGLPTPAPLQGAALWPSPQVESRTFPVGFTPTGTSSPS